MGERKRIFRGDRLRNIRDQHGLTQDELAYRLSIGQSQLARYENGRAEPTPEVIVRLASELDVSADYLLGLSDAPTGQLDENDLSDTERRLLAAYWRGNGERLAALCGYQHPCGERADGRADDAEHLRTLAEAVADGRAWED